MADATVAPDRGSGAAWSRAPELAVRLVRMSRPLDPAPAATAAAPPRLSRKQMYRRRRIAVFASLGNRKSVV